MGKKARFVKQLAEKNQREVTRRFFVDSLHQMQKESKINKSVRTGLIGRKLENMLRKVR
jgi:hypothetical protein